MIRPASFAALAAAALALPMIAGQAQTPPAARPANPLVAEGEQLFHRKCAFCHVGATTGVIMLSRRLGKDQAELPKRTDLEPDYVKAVARNGLNNMPTFTRVEVTDAQLDAIAAYLSRNTPPAGGGAK